MEEFLLGDSDNRDAAEFMVQNRAALDRLKSIRMSFTQRTSTRLGSMYMKPTTPSQ